jgi:hypothetical protein
MANRVMVTLYCKDEASKTFRQFDALVDKVGSNVDAIGDRGKSAFGGLSSSIAGGIIQAKLLIGAFDLAKNAIGGAIEGFQKASDVNEQLILTTGGLMAATGKTYEESAKFIEAFNAKLAQNVGDLPGATQGYLDLSSAISDNLAGAFKRFDGSLDEGGLSKYLQSISTKAGLIGREDIPNMSKALQKILDGKSLSEVFTLDIVGNNPALKAALERQEKQFGSFKDANAKLRAEMLDRALNQAVPPEVLAKIKGTAAASIEGLQSRLFDPTTGIFGFLRDIDTATAGRQSVFDSASESINLLIGGDGILSQVGRLFSEATGLTDSSLMGGLRSGITTVNGWLKGLNDVLKGMKGFNLQGIDLGGMSGDMLNSLLKSATTFLSGIDWTDTGERFGVIIAQGFNQFNRFLNSIDWGTVGQVLWEVTKDAFLFAGAAIGSFAAAFDWSAPVQGFTSFWGDLFSSLSSLIQQGWDYAVKVVQDNIANVVDAFSSLWGQAVNVVQSSGAAVMQGLGSFFSSAINWINDLLAKIPGSPQIGALAIANPNAAGSRYQGYIPNAAGGMIGGLIAAAIREGANMPSGASPVVANTSEAILTQRQQASLARSLSSRSGASLSIGQLVIHSAAVDAAGIAQDVMREIEAQFNQFASSKFTSVEV